ncbi:MAG: hypothetical protein GY953_31055, partial [bacterium]|nr:hypothetical protein [bacterium]
MKPERIHVRTTTAGDADSLAVFVDAPLLEAANALVAARAAQAWDYLWQRQRPAAGEAGPRIDATHFDDVRQLELHVEAEVLRTAVPTLWLDSRCAVRLLHHLGHGCGECRQAVEAAAPQLARLEPGCDPLVNALHHLAGGSREWLSPG